MWYKHLLTPCHYKVIVMTGYVGLHRPELLLYVLDWVWWVLTWGRRGRMRWRNRWRRRRGCLFSLQARVCARASGTLSLTTSKVNQLWESCDLQQPPVGLLCVCVCSGTCSRFRPASCHLPHHFMVSIHPDSSSSETSEPGFYYLLILIIYHINTKTN